MRSNIHRRVACETCKKRKKKCDQTRPHCLRCIKAGKHCPGVPDAVDALFRNTFASTARDAISPIAVQYTEARETGADAQRGGSALHKVDRSILWPEIQVPTEWAAFAKSYHFNVHCSEALSVRRFNPWAELRSMSLQAKSGTALGYAVEADALQLMSLDLRIPNLTQEVNIAYGRALRAINNALSDPIESRDDDIAIAVAIVTGVEFRRQNFDSYAYYKTHTQSLKTLLDHRENSRPLNKKSIQVARQIGTQIIYDHLMTSQPLIGHDRRAIFMDTKHGDLSALDELMATAAVMTELRAEVNAISTVAGFSTQYVSALANQVDMKLLQWKENWITHLRCGSNFELQNNDEVWRNCAHNFNDLSAAILANHYYSLHILSLHDLLKILDSASSLKSEEISASRSAVLSRIADLSDDVCYSIPFITTQLRLSNKYREHSRSHIWAHLSNTSATWIMAPFIIFVFQEHISTDQRAWFRRQLVLLNRDFNLLSASFIPVHTQTFIL